MTDERRPKRERHRRVQERREGSVRGGDRRKKDIPVESERRAGADRRDDERRDGSERRTGADRRRKAT